MSDARVIVEPFVSDADVSLAQVLAIEWAVEHGFVPSRSQVQLIGGAQNWALLWLRRRDGKRGSAEAVRMLRGAGKFTHGAWWIYARVRER